MFSLYHILVFLRLFYDIVTNLCFCNYIDKKYIARHKESMNVGNLTSAIKSFIAQNL